MAERRRGSAPRLNRKRRILLISGLVVLLGGSAGAWAATRPTPPAYRLASAGPAEVTSSLATTGTVESVSQATVGFPVSGQVAAVNVQLGQSVRAGDTLAQLNTTSLDSQLSAAQSKLATAQAKLAADQNSQNALASAPASSAGATAKGSSGKTSAALSGLGGAQSAVLAAQKQVDGDLQLVSAAIKQENATCKPVLAALNSGAATQGSSSSGPSPTPSAAPSQTPTSKPKPDASSTAPSASSSASTSAPTNSAAPPAGGSSRPTRPTTQPPPAGGATQAQAMKCTQELQQVLDDQTRAAGDEKKLAGAESALTNALQHAIAASSQTGGSGSPTGAARGAAATPPTASGAGAAGGRAGSGAPVTADQLAADQAAVDAADAEQAVVQQNVAAATLVSPIAGTVAQVGLSTGQNSSGGSGQDHIVIIGPGADQITTSVSDTQVGRVTTGQAAVITPDGSSMRLAGRVTAIGALGTTTSAGGASYPVTISLDATPQQLYPGATASVSITLATAHADVAVPSSAVHAAGSRHEVTVLQGGSPHQVRVNLGVVGSTVTQVTSGLASGDQVVLADLNAPIPTTGSNPGRGFGGGGGSRRPGG